MEMAVFAGVCAAVAATCLLTWAQTTVRERRKERRAREQALAMGGEGVGIARRASDQRESRGFVTKKQRDMRRIAMERHVPEMIDAVALGMRAGMSFEGAFSLYALRFDDELALACRRACRSWESGLVSRDAALDELAREVDVPSMTRFVGNVERCLRFGSPMSRMFETTAGEARSCYRAKMEEIVAKAPVKMLMPTAGLILPAMLIVVMGPVVLEFL